MKRTTKILLYFVFAIVALVFFLYTRFPMEIVRNTLSAQVKTFNPNADLVMEHIGLTFPPGLKLKPVTVNMSGQPMVRMDDFKVSPRLSNLLAYFTNNEHYAFGGHVGSGVLRGQADMGLQNNRQQTKVAATLTRVPLNYIDLLYQWKNFTPDGELDATITFDSLKGGGSANVNMEISPARISFDPPIMGIEALDFTSLKAQLIVTQRMMQIRNCDATGDQIQGKITGSVVFREPFENSRITFSVTAKPQPAFIEDHKNDLIGGMLASGNAQKRGIVFRISGTINNPRYVIR